MSIKDEVIQYLETSKPIPGNSNDEKLGCFYLDDGVIDSMGIVKMIAEMETKYDIEFAQEDLQSFDFQKVGGLISIIEKHIAEKKG